MLRVLVIYPWIKRVNILLPRLLMVFLSAGRGLMGRQSYCTGIGSKGDAGDGF